MIVTSLDGAWAAIRRGRVVELLAGGAGAVVGRIELDSDDVDIAFVAQPNLLVVVHRSPAARVTVHVPPYLEATARVELELPMRLAAITGSRFALVSQDGRSVRVLRAAGRALTGQPIDPGASVELAVGLERNQLLLGVQKKLEVWDAVSCRPLLRLQLQLPPPPRSVGSALGHLWATRPEADELFVYRLSDGRPFKHRIGTPIVDVISHPASPVIVMVTAGGLVRLHCFAHSLAVIDAPAWRPKLPLAQLVVGDNVSLLGVLDGEPPWHVAIAGATASEAAPVAPASTASSAPNADAPVARAARGWRDPLSAAGAELLAPPRGEVELPIVAVDTELGALAHRLALPPPARKALTALYALYLVGEPAPSIARLAQLLGDWTEPLGQGTLAGLAMLARRGGRVALKATVTDLLDGAPPRGIRIAGETATVRPGIVRVAREGRGDAAIERDLVDKLGRIAIVTGGLAAGTLAARLHDATAVVFGAPAKPPDPLPTAASLAVVVPEGGEQPAWIAALPAL